MAFSNVTYTGDGAITEFQIPFEYLSQTHLVITRDGTPDTNGVEFSINTSTQKVEYVVAPATDVAVKIARVTPIATDERPVDFEGGSGLGEDDLDSVALVSIFLAQEASDDEGASLSLKADITYVDAQDAANSVTDQAYADALVLAAGAGDVFIGAGTTTTDELLQWDATGTKVVKGGIAPDTDVALTADSDTKLATQKATKAYVDTQVATIAPAIQANILYNTGNNVDIEGNSGGTSTNLDHIVEGWVLSASGTAVVEGSKASDIASEQDMTMKLDVTTADATLAAGDFYGLYQKVMGWDVAHLGAGETGASTVTLSFRITASVAGTYCVSLSNGAADRSYVAEYTVLLANTWEDKEVTIPLDTTGTWSKQSDAGLIVTWAIASGTTAQTTAGSWQAGNYRATSNQVNAVGTIFNKVFIKNQKLEVGSTASAHENPRYSDEMDTARSFYSVLENIIFASTTQFTDSLHTDSSWVLGRTMRAAPSMSYSFSSGSGGVLGSNTTSIRQVTGNSVESAATVTANARL